jgi:hypothetical protein
MDSVYSIGFNKKKSLINAQREALFRNVITNSEVEKKFCCGFLHGKIPLLSPLIRGNKKEINTPLKRHENRIVNRHSPFKKISERTFVKYYSYRCVPNQKIPLFRASNLHETIS